MENELFFGTLVFQGGRKERRDKRKEISGVRIGLRVCRSFEKKELRGTKKLQ